MNIISTRAVKIIPFVLGWLLLWFVFCELLFPDNTFVPSPEVVVLAFGDIWSDYNLLVNLFSTVAVIYTSLIISFLAVRLLRNAFFSGKGFVFYFLSSIEWFSEFVPGIIIGILLIFWFPGSDYTELVFAFAASFSSIGLSVVRRRKKINNSYVLAARSLGTPPRTMSLVAFNSIAPRLAGDVLNLHFYLWTMLLVFEFVNRGHGLGAVLAQAFEFNDISAFVAASIIIGLIVWLGSLILKFLQNKFFYWI